MFKVKNLLPVCVTGFLLAAVPVVAEIWPDAGQAGGEQRRLTRSELSSLSILRQNPGRVIAVTEHTPVADWLKLTAGPDQFQTVMLHSEADLRFRAPRLEPTLAEHTPAIRIGLSGQAVSLPRFTMPEGFSRLPFTAQLRAWLSRDLTGLIQPLRAAQQEIGWSDYELHQVIKLYGSALAEPGEQTAFAAAFWQQNGYAVQLGRDPAHPNRWLLMLGLNKPVPGLTLLQTGHHWWWVDAVEPIDSVHVSSTDFGQGQRLRFHSLSERNRTKRFIRQAFTVETNDGRQTVVWEVPEHWALVQPGPGHLYDHFREPIPDYLWQQLVSLFPSEDVVAQTEQFLTWVKGNFVETPASLSVYQSLRLQRQNQRTALVLLADWWQWLTGQPAALVAVDTRWQLALALPDSARAENSISHRGQTWWLPDQTDPATPVIQRWLFLP